MLQKTKNKRFSAGLSTRQKKHIHKTGLGILSLAFFVSSALPIHARTFNPHNILTDAELFNSNAVSKTAIQRFLEQKGSVLASYTQNVNGRTMTAAEMIWEVGNKHGVSQKYILATLEKEQSLVSRTTATQKALDWATGYACFGGGCQEKHRGFYNQIEATAETQEIYRNRKNEFGFRVGVTTQTLDGFNLTPQNQATANQFIYTPYVGYSPELGVTAPYGGNRLLWRIWSRYFTTQQFLDGQVLRNGNAYYLIKNNKKHRYASESVFLADHQQSDAIVVGPTELAAYPDGETILFADNSVVRTTDAGQLYLLTDGVKRPVVDETTALALLDTVSIAIGTNSIQQTNEATLAHYPLGSLITSAATLPQGKLYRGTDGQLWLVRDNLRHLVDSVVWNVRYNNETPEESTGSIESLPTGEPIKLPDGTFAKNPEGKYYIISQGDRMRIEDTGIFSRVFGPDKQQTAVSVSQALLEVHGAGETIEYMDDTIQDPITPTTPAVPTGNYSASFTQMLPEGLIMLTGQTTQVSMVFENNGLTTWQPGSVWLAVTDHNGNPSAFKVEDQINFTESSVASGETATFTFDLTAPGTVGLQPQNFTLYANTGGNTLQIAQVGKFVIVKPSEGGQIIDHNLPLAVRNDWKPLDITLNIKNTSPDLTWLSRRTALEVYNADGSASDFYDSNDWVRRDVAAVPINASSIKPGETGEFKFTIDPRGLKKGTYSLVFKLNLLDKDKQVLLDGNDEWVRLIRVD